MNGAIQTLQIAYVVDDIHAAIRHWTGKVGAGPFFLFEHFQIIDPEYRGQVTTIDVSLALGHFGQQCIELIQQHDDVPSVFREFIADGRTGLHHLGLVTHGVAGDAFDDEMVRYEVMDCPVVFAGNAAIGARFAYFDTLAKLGMYIEAIEATESVKGLFETIKKAASNWDGNEPIRQFQG